MTCREFIGLLDDFLARTLTDAPQRAADEHLGECPYCRDYVQSYRDTVELMKRVLGRDPEAEVPEDVVRQLVDVVLKARPPKD